MLVRLLCSAACCLGLAALMAPFAVRADTDIGYFGDNTLVFAPVGNQVEPDATGKGAIDYQGGVEPKSRWQATFRFSGLDADSDFTVMIKGRFGDPGTDDARALTPLCSFTTDDNGSGSCFWYFRGLARLNVVQVRQGADGSGRRMLQASSDGDPGSITTSPNQYSPGNQATSRKNGKASSNSRGKAGGKASSPPAVETPTPQV